jgi:DNA-binding response OmpR family regulator
MSSNPPLVIIVEDEPDTADMFAEILRIQGYRVKKAYGGTAGIDLITRETPDAVVLDLMMPDVSGLEVFRFMRRDPGLENVPVVVVSGRPMPEEMLIGEENHTTLYLMKPIGVTELTGAIENVLKNSKPGPD